MNAPLVFLPGWCLGRTPLTATVAALNGQIIDLPGYGSTPLITDFYIAAGFGNPAVNLHPAQGADFIGNGSPLYYSGYL